MTMAIPASSVRLLRAQFPARLALSVDVSYTEGLLPAALLVDVSNAEGLLPAALFVVLSNAGDLLSAALFVPGVIATVFTSVVFVVGISIVDILIFLVVI